MAARKTKYLREEAGERRNAGEREHQHRQDEGQRLVGAREAGEIGDLLDLAVLAAHGEDAGEGAERHDQVDHHVDDDAAHALLASRRRGRPAR